MCVCVNDLPSNNRQLVDVVCDVCESKKKIPFYAYKKSTNNGGYYSCCSKCSRLKVKQTNLERYGVEHVSQSEEIKEKVKQTNLERYGVKCSLHNENIKEKVKQTNLERYGVEHVSQSEEIGIIL